MHTLQVTHSVLTVHMLMVQSSPPAVKMYFPSYEQAISITLVEGEERIIKRLADTHMGTISPVLGVL